MRIKFYLAGLMVFSLVGAYGLERFLSEQHHELRLIDHEVNELELRQKDFVRVQGAIRQLLTSSDLVFDAGNKELLGGAVNIANDLRLELNQMIEYEASWEQKILLGKVHKSVDIIGDILNMENALSRLSSDDRFYIMQQYQAASSSIDRNLSRAQELNRAEVSDKKLQRLNQEKRLSYLSYFSKAMLLLVVASMWYWANKKICHPLSLIQSYSKLAMQGKPLETTPGAPVEIYELSKDLKRLADTLLYQSDYDHLTGLKNRRAFERDLNLKEDLGEENYVCFIDLDYFKCINDTCGHAVGDDVLFKVAKIIEFHTRPSDLVARLGGDEFVVFFRNCSLTSVKIITHELCKNISKIQYMSGGEALNLSTSIGISDTVSAQSEMHDALYSADVACQLAKKNGRNAVVVFNKNDEESFEKRNEMITMQHIEVAIKEDQFMLYKQDIVSMKEDTIERSFEILLRLQNRNGDIVTPIDFFSVAERYNKSADIDRWVVGACLDWFQKNKEVLDYVGFFSINLSAKSLVSTIMQDYIIGQVEQSGIAPEKICFEVTETAAIDNIAKARLFIEKLKRLGCMFAIDDFGCGHSSYSRVKDLPTDKIKIDGSFVSSMLDSQLDYAAVKSICEIAKAANREIVAEYVESKEIAEALDELGVDYAQGYYFNRPEKLTVESIYPKHAIAPKNLEPGYSQRFLH